MSKYRLDKDDVRQLCIENRYFTHGTNEQYEEMFEWVDRFNDYNLTSSLSSIAFSIYFCSTGVSEIEILKQLVDLLEVVEDE